MTVGYYSWSTLKSRTMWYNFILSVPYCDKQTAIFLPMAMKKKRYRVFLETERKCKENKWNIICRGLGGRDKSLFLRWVSRFEDNFVSKVKNRRCFLFHAKECNKNVSQINSTKPSKGVIQFSCTCYITRSESFAAPSRFNTCCRVWHFQYVWYVPSRIFISFVHIAGISNKTWPAFKFRLIFPNYDKNWPLLTVTNDWQKFVENCKNQFFGKWEFKFYLFLVYPNFMSNRTLLYMVIQLHVHVNRHVIKLYEVEAEHWLAAPRQCINRTYISRSKEAPFVCKKLN